VADVEGNVTIPTADGTPLVVDGIVQGWGAVPYLARVTCWCANAQGTYAAPADGCAPTPCPFPERCVDAAWAPGNTNPFVKRNGTKCIDGAEGAACLLCSKRFYRYQDSCRACPTGVPVGVILLAILGGGFLLYVSSKLSKLTTPQAVALVRVRGSAAAPASLHAACMPCG
jgi:hypothetical protein